MFLIPIIIIFLLLLWFMIYRYTEHYKVLQHELRQAIKHDDGGKRVHWGETPKHEPTGRWPRVVAYRTEKRSADEPQLLLGGLTYREAQKKVLTDQCEIMNRLNIKNVEDYQKWYEQIKDEDDHENALRTVSGCVQAGLFASNKKLEDLIEF